MKSTIDEQIQEQMLRIEELKKAMPKRELNPKDKPTEEELKRYQIRDQRARELGIVIDITTYEGEEEDLDKLRAYVVYIMKDKEVPVELKEKILKKNREQEYRQKK